MAIIFWLWLSVSPLGLDKDGKVSKPEAQVYWVVLFLQDEHKEAKTKSQGQETEGEG